MKIAYIIDPQVIVSNKSNGIRSQAETWAKMLINEGHTVDLVSNWGNYNWNTYDAIHFFGIGVWCRKTAMRLSKLNSKLICSPIIDFSPDFDERANNIKKTMSKLSHGKISSNVYEKLKNYHHFCKICVRSQFELEFIHRNYDVPKERFAVVPLAYSPSCQPYVPVPKENFCLHISSIYQSRKNVIRLIDAAKKYKFKLVLAGNKGNEQQYAPIRSAIGNSSNIKVLGFISEEEKIELYKKAKVFALPSISEGVGIVALDAAYYGCEVVITNIPGPKEYYQGNCVEVDPFDVDNIGIAISQLLGGEINFQPSTSQFIKENFSESNISKRLVDAYKSL